MFLFKPQTPSPLSPTPYPIPHVQDQLVNDFSSAHQITFSIVYTAERQMFEFSAQFGDQIWLPLVRVFCYPKEKVLSTLMKCEDGVLRVSPHFPLLSCLWSETICLAEKQNTIKRSEPRCFLGMLFNSILKPWRRVFQMFIIPWGCADDNCFGHLYMPESGNCQFFSYSFSIDTTQTIEERMNLA